MATKGLVRAADARDGRGHAAVEHYDLARPGDDALDEEVEIVVAHIKRLARSSTLEFALRVGAVIIYHFYGGNIDAWRSRGPKTASFRSLARRPDLALSAGSLYRCVAVFELCERLDARDGWEHLGVSHLRAVLGLPPSAQERLLTAANAQRWTVKMLQQEALRAKSTRSTRGGRRAQAPITKSLKALRQSLETHRDSVGQVGISDLDVEQNKGLIEQTRKCIDRLSSTLSAKAEKSRPNPKSL